MANINTIKNAVEIHTEFKANGTKIEYIVINGQKCGILGSINEADRNAALKTLQDAYVASGGNIFAMMQNLSAIAEMEEKHIEPDEVITVCGKELILSYGSKKLYTMRGDEVVNCEDLPDMSNEAIKAVLVARATAELK